MKKIKKLLMATTAFMLIFTTTSYATQIDLEPDATYQDVHEEELTTSDAEFVYGYEEELVMNDTAFICYGYEEYPYESQSLNLSLYSAACNHVLLSLFIGHTQMQSSEGHTCFDTRFYKCVDCGVQVEPSVSDGNHFLGGHSYGAPVSGNHSGNVHYFTKYCSVCSRAETYSQPCPSPPCKITNSLPLDIE